MTINKIDELHSRIVRAAIELCKLKKNSTLPDSPVSPAELELANYDYGVPVRSLQAIDSSANAFINKAYTWAEYKVRHGFRIDEKDIHAAITRFTLMD